MAEDTKITITSTPRNNGKSFYNQFTNFYHMGGVVGQPTYTWTTGTITTDELKGEQVSKLYNVIVVQFGAEIIIDEKVVASSEEEAKFEAGVYCALKENRLDFDDVDIFVNVLGTLKD